MTLGFYFFIAGFHIPFNFLLNFMKLRRIRLENTRYMLKKFLSLIYTILGNLGVRDSNSKFQFYTWKKNASIKGKNKNSAQDRLRETMGQEENLTLSIF